MGRLKDRYRRFIEWQQRPYQVAEKSAEHYCCCSCGEEYQGNFCPRCGQRSGVGRVGWNSIKENITLLWGMDSRSLIYTLVQLLGRPGYLVREYISGRRQVSFPPVKMLVIVCLFVIIFESVFHVKNDVLGLTFNVKEVDDAIAWINAQKNWATLLVNSIYILPTWLVFRFAPDYPRHTLPEGFFLQVFLSVQALLLSFFGYWSATVELVLSIVFMYITYRQLFGYGWWGTLWRLASVLLSRVAVMVEAVAILIYFYSYDDELKADLDLAKAFLFIITTVALLMGVVLGVTHLINKRTAHQGKGQGWGQDVRHHRNTTCEAAD